MKLKWVKKILLLVIVASIFSISNVKADLPQCTTKYPGETDLTDAYNFDIDKKDGLYYITANPKSDDKDLLKKMKTVTFVVDKIIPNNDTYNNSGWIGKSMLPTETLVMNITGIGSTDAGPGVEVELKATNLEAAGICKGWGTVSVAISDFVDDTMHEEFTLGGGGEISVEAGKEIKCDNSHLVNYGPGSFEAKFCEAKLGAKTTNKEIDGKRVYYTGSHAFNEKDENNVLQITRFDKDKKLAFKCDPSWGGTATAQNGTHFQVNTLDEALSFISNAENEEYKADYGYYFTQNTAYLYGEGEKSVNLGKYWYHYHSNHSTEGAAITCHVKCEEGVIVQYGPPVAGKAGMCFDYQIKVESRVNCHAIEKVPLPQDKFSICTPTPRCVSKSGHVYNQGGPDDDFQACVESCDGGKYTDKCTKSCYKKYYGKNFKSDNVNLITPQMRQTAQTVDKGSLSDANAWFTAAKNGNAGETPDWYKKPKHKSYGAYVERGNTIYWYHSIVVTNNKITGGNDDNHKGRWYFYHDWGFNHPYPRIENGIPRSKYCSDDCNWVHNCSSNEYLNYGLAEKDYEDNYKKYEAAVKQCNAMSKCHTESSTYTISATYKQKGGEEQTKVFPSSGSIELNSCQVDEDKVATEEINTHTSRPESIIKRFGGCYKLEGCKYNSEDYPTAGKYYMSEWTFPGSYTNKKTGEISYDPKYASDGKWRTRKRKFCLPRDAEPVNSFWYYWYFATHEGYTYAQDNCLTPKVKEFIRTTETKYDESKTDAGIKWNINGNTRGFGFFKWNIDVSCFYAVDDGTDATTTVTTNDDSTAEVNCRNTEYRVRTVTNNELFPSSTSEETADGTTAGREAGFNWTKNATLHVGDVGDSFANDPTQVKNYIETMKNEIYSSSDKYVDYQFKLTPQVISQIKNYNSKVKSYDTYCGNMVEVKNPKGEIAFFAYESNLFRPNVAVDATACPTALNSVNINTERVGNILCNNDAANHTNCNTTYEAE